MDRLFAWKISVWGCLAALGLAAFLALAPLAAHKEAQPVFFSLLFPQLMPGFAGESPEAMTPGEAVAL